jgi:beta-1,4-N-acetylglucosaminyltransferase
MKKAHKRIKICLVSSRGGHLYQICQLRTWWGRYERFWITGRGADEAYLLKGEQKYYAYFPESRSIVNAIKNFFLALRILQKEKPALVASCGAGVAPPVFAAAALLNIQTVFIDSISFVHYPSLSARLVSFFATKTFVQHPHMVNKLYRAEYWGHLL